MGAAEETVGVRQVERQVVGKDAVPQFGLGMRHRIMGLGLFLNVVRAGNHLVLGDLDHSDLLHVQNDLSILRIALVSPFSSKKK